MHYCYAFRLKPNGSLYRYSDDGEPANTGGKPIYGQLLSFEVTQVAVIVVRYYGGTKLGVGGLITAYKEAAKEALLAAEIYEQTAQINQIIHHQKLTIIHQDFGASCSFTLEFPLHKKASMITLFQSLQGIETKNPLTHL